MLLFLMFLENDDNDGEGGDEGSVRQKRDRGSVASTNFAEALLGRKGNSGGTNVNRSHSLDPGALWSSADNLGVSRPLSYVKLLSTVSPPHDVNTLHPTGKFMFPNGNIGMTSLCWILKRLCHFLRILLPLELRSAYGEE